MCMRPGIAYARGARQAADHASYNMIQVDMCRS